MCQDWRVDMLVIALFFWKPLSVCSMHQAIYLLDQPSSREYIWTFQMLVGDCSTTGDVSLDVPLVVNQNSHSQGQSPASLHVTALSDLQPDMHGDCYKSYQLTGRLFDPAAHVCILSYSTVSDPDVEGGGGGGFCAQTKAPTCTHPGTYERADGAGNWLL